LFKFKLIAGIKRSQNVTDLMRVLNTLASAESTGLSSILPYEKNTHIAALNISRLIADPNCFNIKIRSNLITKAPKSKRKICCVLKTRFALP
jgi:hypothetical protein